MTPQTTPLPYQGTLAGFRRFSVPEYHRLIELGILTEDDNLELLEGYLVHKMSRNPPHDAALQKGTKRWLRFLPPGWDLRVQSAVTNRLDTMTGQMLNIQIGTRVDPRDGAAAPALRRSAHPSRGDPLSDSPAAHSTLVVKVLGPPPPLR